MKGGLYIMIPIENAEYVEFTPDGVITTMGIEEFTMAMSALRDCITNLIPAEQENDLELIAGLLENINSLVMRRGRKKK